MCLTRGPAAPGSVRRPAMPLVHRRTPLAVLAALLLLVAYLAVTPGRSAAAGALLSQGMPATASTTENAATPAQRRGRRQRGHPMVQRVRRPAVAAGRPRRDRHDRPGHAELGGRVRAVVPDPGRAPRGPVHDDLLARPGTGGIQTLAVTRHRPVRPDERHRAGHRVRLLAVGVPGLRYARRPRPAARPTRPSAGRRPHPSTENAAAPATRSTATAAPAGPPRSPTRSGCRSTSARPRRCAG